MRIILTMRPRKNSFIPIEAEGIVPSILMNGDRDHRLGGNRERRLEEVFEVESRARRRRSSRWGGARGGQSR
jgi:hypothetical protein